MRFETVPVPETQEDEPRAHLDLIVEDQLAYYLAHSAPKFSLKGSFPTRWVERGGKTRPELDLEHYPFTEETIEEEAQREKETLFEKRFARLDALRKEAQKIPLETETKKDIPAPEAEEEAPPFSLRALLKDPARYRAALRDIIKRFDRAEEILPALHKRAGMLARVEEEELITFFTNRFLTRPGIAPETIREIVHDISHSGTEHARVVEDTALEKERIRTARRTIGNIWGDVDALVHATDTKDPDFLRSDERAPVSVSLWLYALERNLKQADFAGTADVLGTLTGHIEYRAADLAALRNAVNQEILKRLEAKSEDKETQEKLSALESGIAKTLQAEVLRRRMRAGTRETFEEELNRFYGEDEIGKERERARHEGMKRAWDASRGMPAESAEPKESAEESVPSAESGEPTRALQPYRELESSFRPVNRERLHELKGRIETLDARLADGALFITRRANLGSRGYEALPEKLEQADIAQMAGNETVSAKESIVRVPCAHAAMIAVPLPSGYALKKIGWAPSDAPREGEMRPLETVRNIAAGTYLFSNPHGRGWVHYFIEKLPEPPRIEKEKARDLLPASETPLDSKPVTELIAHARSIHVLSERARFLETGLQQLGFVYDYGVEALDEIYHRTGRERLYALVESIGIGHCQLFSQMLGRIFRRAGIPARIVAGEQSEHGAFKAVGHAKVEYADETGVLHEAEATRISLLSASKVKQQYDAARIRALGREAATVKSPNEFQRLCAAIREELLERLEKEETDMRALDRFLEKFAEMQTEDLETADDLLALLRLGESYGWNRITSFTLRDAIAKIPPEDSERRERLERYAKIDPWGMCLRLFKNRLLARVAEGRYAAEELGGIMDAILRKSTGEWDMTSQGAWQVQALQAAFDLVRAHKLDPGIFFNRPHVARVMAQAVQHTRGRELFGSDLEPALALLAPIIDSGVHFKEAWVLTTETLGQAHTNSDEPETKPRLHKERAVRTWLETRPDEVKQRLISPDNWPEWHNRPAGLNALLKERAALGIAKDAEPSLAHSILRRYVKEDMRSAYDLLHELAKSSIAFGGENDAEGRHIIEEILNNEVENLLRREAPINVPWVERTEDISGLASDEIRAILAADMKESGETRAEGVYKPVAVHETYMHLKAYFPALALDPLLKTLWDTAYNTRGKHEAPPLTIYPEIRNEDFYIYFSIIDVRAGGTGYINLFAHSRFIEDSLLRALCGEETFKLLRALETTPLQSEPASYMTLLAVRALEADASAHEAIKTYTEKYVGEIWRKVTRLILKGSDNALKNKLWMEDVRASELDLRESFKGKPSPFPEFPLPEADDSVQELHRALHMNAVQNKEIQERAGADASGHRAQGQPELTKIPAEIRQNFWRQYADRRFSNVGHSIGIFQELDPEFAALLYDTATKGPRFAHELQVLERTFRNSLDRAGEFINVNQAFPERGYEFGDIKEYERGDDTRAIDWNASARTGKTLVRRSYREQEPKKTVCVMNLDNLVMKSKDEFETYANWGDIFKEVHDKLAALFVRYAEARKPVDVHLIFHGEEVYHITFPAGRGPDFNRFEALRSALVRIFWECNRYLAILKTEYKEVEEGSAPRFLKPDVRTLPGARGPANVIMIEHRRTGSAGRLGKLHNATISAMR